jgi:hypothetical protein
MGKGSKFHGVTFVQIFKDLLREENCKKDLQWGEISKC